MDKIKDFFNKFEEFKKSEAGIKENFRQKTKLKLALVTFPTLIVLLVFVRKNTLIDEHVLLFVLLFIGILVINFGANYLTRKKFKD